MSIKIEFKKVEEEVIEIARKFGVPLWIFEDDEIQKCIILIKEVTIESSFYEGVEEFLRSLTKGMTQKRQQALADKVTFKRMIELTKTNPEFKKKFNKAQEIIKGRIKC